MASVTHNRKSVLLIARFLAVGVAGFLCNYAVLHVVLAFHEDQKVVGEVIAAAVALHLTFALHDNWTYHAQNAALKLALKTRYISYLASNSIGSIMTVVIFAFMSRYLDTFLALSVSAGAAMVWNFIMNKVVIWRHEQSSETSS